MALTPFAVFRHCFERPPWHVVEQRFVDVAKAVLDSRHDIELLAALLAPSLFFRSFQARKCSSRISIVTRTIEAVAAVYDRRQDRFVGRFGPDRAPLPRLCAERAFF
jgi:hypothetical protein